MIAVGRQAAHTKQDVLRGAAEGENIQLGDVRVVVKGAHPGVARTACRSINRIWVHLDSGNTGWFAPEDVEPEW